VPNGVLFEIMEISWLAKYSVLSFQSLIYIHNNKQSTFHLNLPSRSTLSSGRG
jgi:hypothetical protein